jgi:hypothetical protein
MKAEETRCNPTQNRKRPHGAVGDTTSYVPGQQFFYSPSPALPLAQPAYNLPYVRYGGLGFQVVLTW